MARIGQPSFSDMHLTTVILGIICMFSLRYKKNGDSAVGTFRALRGKVMRLIFSFVDISTNKIVASGGVNIHKYLPVAKPFHPQKVNLWSTFFENDEDATQTVNSYRNSHMISDFTVKSKIWMLKIYGFVAQEIFRTSNFTIC